MFSCYSNTCVNDHLSIRASTLRSPHRLNHLYIRTIQTTLAVIWLIGKLLLAVYFLVFIIIIFIIILHTFSVFYFSYISVNYAINGQMQLLLVTNDMFLFLLLIALTPLSLAYLVHIKGIKVTEYMTTKTTISAQFKSKHLL